MANNLENMLYKSVDLVRRGANPDADIKLYKSLQGPVPIMKSDEAIEDMIEKSYNTMDSYCEALMKSYDSILGDSSISEETAREMMAKSIAEFNEAVLYDVIKEFTYQEDEEEPEEMMDEEEQTFDASNLSKSEKATFDALLAKACGKKIEKEDPEIVIEDDEEGQEDDLEKEADELLDEETMKSLNPAIAKTLERLENLTKSAEMKQFEDLAKKYEPLGENVEELAKTFYDLKQQGENVYKSYVSVLEKSLNIMNNSGLFGEIGKSATHTGIAKGAVEGQIEAIAGEIMKSNPGYTKQQAVAKAWNDNPDLAIAYEESRR